MGIEQTPILRVGDLGLLGPVFGFQPGDPGGITLATPWLTFPFLPLFSMYFPAEGFMQHF